MTFPDSVSGRRSILHNVGTLKLYLIGPFLGHNIRMLAEFVKYLTTPASRYARELGYLKESIAFEARAQRHWKMWESHFQNSQDLITQQSEKIRKNRSIWILGSGSLYETPWKFLAGEGYRLKLVDVYHPPRIKKLVKSFSNIQYLEMDVTGFDDLSPLQKVLLKNPMVPPLTIHPEDLIVSCNMLSQLPICPLQYLSKNTEISAEEKIQWARKIQSHHWRWLQSFGCQVLIISDFEIHHLGKNLEVFRIEEQPFRPLAEKLTHWNWSWSETCVRKVEAYSIPRKI